MDEDFEEDERNAAFVTWTSSCERPRCYGVAVDEKTVRLLDRVTDKLATKIAEKIVDNLALRLADKIAERIVQRQRWAGMTDEEHADECLRLAGWTRNPTSGWTPPAKPVRRRKGDPIAT